MLEHVAQRSCEYPNLEVFKAEVDEALNILV